MRFNEWYSDTEFNPMIYGALQAAWEASEKATIERCAKLCESNDLSWADHDWNSAVIDYAKKIRAMEAGK